MRMSVVYLDGSDDMISARLVCFMPPKRRAEPGTSVAGRVAFSFSACSSYCFLWVAK